MVLAPVLLILAASQVHCPGESGRVGRYRDPVARHADVETASIPIELDFGRYRHAQEVTDSMSIETADWPADDCIGISVLDCLQCDGTGTVRLDPGRGNRPTRSGR
jgi:hypothetical protein